MRPEVRAHCRGDQRVRPVHQRTRQHHQKHVRGHVHAAVLPVHVQHRDGEVDEAGGCEGPGVEPVRHVPGDDAARHAADVEERGQLASLGGGEILPADLRALDVEREPVQERVRHQLGEEEAQRKGDHAGDLERRREPRRLGFTPLLRALDRGLGDVAVGRHEPPLALGRVTRGTRRGLVAGVLRRHHEPAVH